MWRQHAWLLQARILTLFSFEAESFLFSPASCNPPRQGKHIIRLHKYLTKEIVGFTHQRRTRSPADHQSIACSLAEEARKTRNNLLSNGGGRAAGVRTAGVHRRGEGPDLPLREEPRVRARPHRHLQEVAQAPRVHQATGMPPFRSHSSVSLLVFRSQVQILIKRFSSLQDPTGQVTFKHGDKTIVGKTMNLSKNKTGIECMAL
jgi:hypothetical protein